MKSIKQQYIDLREGNMSQANFMRNLRMTMPQYVTNVTSFEDSVRILKNKGILTEADTAEGKYKKVTGKDLYGSFKEVDNLNGHEVLIGIDYEIEKDHELTKEEATKIVLKNLKKDPYYYTAALMSGTEGYKSEYIGGKSAQPEARQMQPLDKNMGNVVDKKMGMQPVKDVEKVKKDSDKATAQKYKTSGISLMSLVAKTTRGVKKMDPTGEKMKKITMNEGQYDFIGRFRSGEEKILRNTISDAKIEVEEEDQKVTTYVTSEKHSDEEVKKAVRNIVNKKVDEVRLNDLPNETPGLIAQQIMDHINKNEILQSYSDKITLQSNPDGFLRFGYWEELPTDAIKALSLLFNIKSEIIDDDSDTSRGVFYRLSPKSSVDENKVAKTIFDKNKLAIKNTTKIGKGEEIEQRKLTKADLMKMIREELAERFDGMEQVPMSLKKLDENWITPQEVEEDYGFYSDMYKEEYGFRPRIPAEQLADWLNSTFKLDGKTIVKK